MKTEYPAFDSVDEFKPGDWVIGYGEYTGPNHVKFQIEYISGYLLVGKYGKIHYKACRKLRRPSKYWLKIDEIGTPMNYGSGNCPPACEKDGMWVEVELKN